MKKTNFISIIFLAAVLFSGCKENFLDQEKPLVATEGLIYTNGDQTLMALQGLYSTLKGVYTVDKGVEGDFMGGKTYVAFDNRGDDIKNLDPNLVTLFDTYQMRVGISSQENEAAWYQAYLTINRSNVFIQSIEDFKTADVVGEATAKQYVAEAKFIRSLTYYYLLHLYATPYVVDKEAIAFPLRLTAVKGSGESQFPSSKVKDVYAAILDDLSDANIQELPAASNSADAVTRATQGAAYMLRMRVYMAMADWQNALNDGLKVTGYELAKTVTAQFATPYYTKETIFALPQSTNDKPNTQKGLTEYYRTGSICVIDKDNGVMSLPEYSLPDDQRVAAFDDNGRLAKWDQSDKLQWVPIFRFAETKLNLAECYAKLNNAAGARAALNDVRSRSISPADDILDVSTLSGNDLLNAITNEKRLEFLGEGMRGIEIMRKGEHFIKKGLNLDVAPGSTEYTWPVPQSERVVNSLWNTLAK